MAPYTASQYTGTDPINLSGTPVYLTLYDIQIQINKYRTGELLTTASGAETDIIAMVTGLQTRLNNSPITAATTHAITDSRSTELDVEIMEATQDLQVMKDRVASLRNPYVSQSYYESWFPINRPLRNVSIIVLLALGIFFYVFTLFTLMNSFGLHVRLNIAWWSPENMVKLGKLMPYGGGIIILILIVVCVIGYVRKG